MKNNSHFVITDHAIDRFIKRFKQLFNREYTKDEAREKILGFLKKAKRISQPPRMSWQTYINYQVKRKQSEYYEYSGWIFVVELHNEVRRVITIYMNSKRYDI